MRLRHGLLCLVGLLGSSAPALAQTVTVDPSVKYQTIEGFGGFGAAKVWWDEEPFFDARWLDKLDDLGATIVRTQVYWDFQTRDKRLHVEPSSGNGKQIPYLRALKARGFKIFAAVWTPPVWMKVDPDDKLARFCSGQCGGRLAPAHYQDFADYLVLYVRHMRAEGVHIDALSIANEPLFANPFESCTYTAKSYAKVLGIVGAAFAKAGLTTKLYGPEHMGSLGSNEQFFETVLDDRDVAKHLGFYAVHSYIDGVAPDYGSAPGWSKLSDRVLAAGKQLWMTETSDYDTKGWDKAFSMAKGLHLALRFGKISGWVYWYMGGDVLTDAPESAPTPLYHAFKQYYRYVRPGSVQVKSSVDDAAILSTAFRLGDGLTVVLINNAATSKKIKVRLASGSLPKLDIIRTSRSEGAVLVGATDGTAVDLPAQSITTLHARPSRDSAGLGTTSWVALDAGGATGAETPAAPGRWKHALGALAFILIAVVGALALGFARSAASARRHHP